MEETLEGGRQKSYMNAGAKYQKVCVTKTGENEDHAIISEEFI